MGRQTAVIGTPVVIGGVTVRLRSETVYNDLGQVEAQKTNIVQYTDGVTPPDDSNVQTTTYEYDERGSVIKTTFADSTSIEIAYDELGRKISETNQLGKIRTFAYDEQGRLASVTLPDLDGNPLTTGDIATYEYGYDQFGNQTLLTDPLGRETRWTFDEQGRPLTRTLPLGFGPDGIEGTGDDQTLPEGDFTEHFEYDERGRRTLHVSFEGAVTESVYDPATGRLSERRFFDNLTSYDDGNGTPAEVWEYAYDPFGRVVAVDQLTGGSSQRLVTMTYDAQGRLTSESTPEGTIVYEYDNLGRRTATKSYGPDFTPADGDDFEQITQYTYDELSRLKTVVVIERDDATLSTPEVTTYDYDLLGNLDAMTAANGVISDYTYDDLNRLDTLTHFLDDGAVNGVYDSGSDTLIASFDYTARDDGKRTGATEVFETSSGTLTNTISWEYDNLGRLVGEEFDSSDNALDYYHEYDYDLTGNRDEWRKYDSDGGTLQETVTYTYDANDRMGTETSSLGPVTTYSYDATQQTGKEVKISGVVQSNQTFEYDLQGRMSAVVNEEYTSGSLSSRTRIEFDYDHRGHRVISIESSDGDLNGSFETTGGSTTFLVDHSGFTGYPQTITEITKDNTGTETKRIIYTFGHDEISQTTVDGSGTQTLIFGHDGHGSVRMLLDAIGALAVVATVEQLFHYTAYGVTHGYSPSQAATNRQFNSEPRDTATGLYYHDARWLNVSTGTWNRLDDFFGSLWDPQSFHKRLFVHGDPINGLDPNGLFLSVAIGFGGSLVSRVGWGGAIFTAGTTITSSLVYQFYFDDSPVKGALLGSKLGLALNWAYVSGGGGPQSVSSVLKVSMKGFWAGASKIFTEIVSRTIDDTLNQWTSPQIFQSFYEGFVAGAWVDTWGNFLEEEAASVLDDPLVEAGAVFGFSLISSVIDEIDDYSSGDKEFFEALRDAFGNAQVGFAESRVVNEQLRGLPAPAQRLIKQTFLSIYSEGADAVVGILESFFSLLSRGDDR